MRPFLQNYKFTNKNYLLSALRVVKNLWGIHYSYLYNNLSISVRLSVRMLSPPTFMVRFEL